MLCWALVNGKWHLERKLGYTKQMILEVKNEFKTHYFKPWLDLEMLKLV